MKIIESTSNPSVKHFIKLKKRSYRKQHQQFIAEGIRTCSTLAHMYDPSQIFMTLACYDDQNRPHFEESKIIIVSNAVIEKMSSAKNPSGICAIFMMQPHTNLPTHGPGIVLVDINDPGNMGTIIRSAAAMNITHVICIEGVDPYHPKVIQATTGTIATIKLYQTTWENLKQQQLPLCALVVKHGKSPHQLNLDTSFVVLGNEAHGLTEEQINDCTTTMTIPMPGNTESLNAGIAGSIALYLISQQNKFSC